MRRIAGLAIGLLLVLVGLVTLGLLAFPPAAALRAELTERLTNETPEAKVAVYVRAVAKGDEVAALEAWVVPSGIAQSEVAARRERFTREWIGRRMQPNLTIQAIEWWRTCCEPSVTQDLRNAGGARVRVLWNDQSGTAESYFFDVFARGGAYWGEALGFPARQWEIREVYPAGVEPLYWKFSSRP